MVHATAEVYELEEDRPFFFKRKKWIEEDSDSQAKSPTQNKGSYGMLHLPGDRRERSELDRKACVEQANQRKGTETLL